mgnify:CR=1
MIEREDIRTMPNHLHEAANFFAELGYLVFPCRPGSKQPATPNGLHDATTDTEQIDAWWTQNPRYNVAISTVGLCVIDQDTIDGKPNPWVQSMRDDFRELIMDCPRTMTPRGGLHLWFRDDGEPIRNSASKLAPKVDVRGTGGYVLVPPSEIAGGKHYEWMPYADLNISRDRLPQVPAEISEYLRSETPVVKTETPSEQTADLESQEIIPDGQRNQTLTRYAGHMRQSGMNEQEIKAALRAMNVIRCRPMLADTEVDKIAWSVARYEPEQARMATLQGWFEQDQQAGSEDDLPEIEEDDDDLITDPGPFPAELINVPGFIGDVVRFNLAGAFKPQPELALAGAICLLATVTGRKVANKNDHRTNIYIIGVCGSGGGKERARKVNKELLHKAGLEEYIGPESIGSSAGLLSCVESHPAILLQVDEIGRMMQTVAKGGAASPHLFNIPTVLMRLFSSSNSLYIGDAYADLNKVKKISQPHCCLYGTTVKQPLLDSISPQSITDGFLARLVIIEAQNNNPLPVESVTVDPPTSLLDELQWWHQFAPGGNLSQQVPQPRILTESEGARDAFQLLQETIRQECERVEEYSELWNRCFEKALKLAMLCEVSTDRESTEIHTESAVWGCRLAEYTTRRLIWMADKCIHHNDYHSYQKKILEFIQAKRGRVTRTMLTKRFQYIRARELQEMLERLIDIGEIAMSTHKNPQGGRPTTHIYLSQTSKEINKTYLLCPKSKREGEGNRMISRTR